MHSQKMPFTQINLNKTEANQAPITVNHILHRSILVR